MPRPQHPGFVVQPNTLGPTRCSGRINEHRQSFRGDGGDGLAHALWLVGQILIPKLGEFLKGQHPISVGRTVERHHLGQGGQIGAACGQLG